MRKDKLILTALALTVAFPPFAWAQSSSPIPIAKSYRIDMKGLAKKANSGSTVAQFQLGLAYQFEQEVDKDTFEAIRW
jgi:TPR repeat protein